MWLIFSLMVPLQTPGSFLSPWADGCKSLLWRSMGLAHFLCLSLPPQFFPTNFTHLCPGKSHHRLLDSEYSRLLPRLPFPVLHAGNPWDGKLRTHLPCLSSLEDPIPRSLVSMIWITLLPVPSLVFPDGLPSSLCFSRAGCRTVCVFSFNKK